jgi:hypothetical protein
MSEINPHLCLKNPQYTATLLISSRSQSEHCQPSATNLKDQLVSSWSFFACNLVFVGGRGGLALGCF